MNILDDMFTQWEERKEVPAILISTDLEPDDVVAIYLLLHYLKDRQEEMNLTFLVGEGHAGKKVVRMTKMIEQFRYENLLPLNIKTEVLAGDVIAGIGSTKNFEQDGEELFSGEVILALLKKGGYREGVSEEETNLTLERVRNYFGEFPAAFVLALKPLREFAAIAFEGTELFSRATLASYNSFNLRTLIAEPAELLSLLGATTEEEAARSVKDLISQMHKQFKTVYFFENYPVLGSNNTLSEEGSSELFSLIKEIFPALTKLMENWKLHLLGDDPRKIAAYLIDSSKEEDLIKLLQGTWTSESEKAVFKLISFDNISDEGKRKREEDKIKRKLKKWKSLTSQGMQFVLADPALVLSLLGQISTAFVPASIGFNESYYTTYQEPITADQAGENLRLCVPLNLDGEPLSVTSLATIIRLNSELRSATDKLKSCEEADIPQNSLVVARLEQSLKEMPCLSGYQMICRMRALDSMLTTFRRLSLVIRPRISEHFERMRKEFEESLKTGDFDDVVKFFQSYNCQPDEWKKFSSHVSHSPSEYEVDIVMDHYDCSPRTARRDATSYFDTIASAKYYGITDRRTLDLLESYMKHGRATSNESLPTSKTASTVSLRQ